MRQKVLVPATILPADEVFTRRHSPSPVKNYALYRGCLRWEFGFTCAICLLHERDIMAYGVEGWGTMTIEHMVARTQDPNLLGTYANLLYVCRLCNQSRSDTDIFSGTGERLLDPTRDIWAQHFRVSDDKLVPLDSDAAYTDEVYGMNEPRRRKLRRLRRERVKVWDELLQAGNNIANLMKLCPRWWIPDDYPRDCRCRQSKARRLPDVYLRQAGPSFDQ